MSATHTRTPKVSVVIPAWNSESTLERALNSVRTQSLSAAEVWIVDDASTDPTVQLARSFIQKHRLTGWHVKAFGENRGPSRARNWGWDQASGDYVAFLDADDSWHPRKLEVQALWMEAHTGCTLSGHAHSLFAPGASNTPENSITPGHTTITPTQVLMCNPFITPSIMVRRSCALRFEEGRRHMEDHFLWMRMALQGHVLCRLNASLAYIHKAAWGASGLSAQMWRMEKAELDNYSDLYRANLIGPATCTLLHVWSILKHARRLAIHTLRGASQA